MTRFEAQRKLGLFAPHDFVSAFLVLGLSAWAFAWVALGEPTLIHLACVMFGAVFVFMVWSVVLIYRAIIFVLDMQADVNLMPEVSARIAAGYLRGVGAPPADKK